MRELVGVAAEGADAAPLQSLRVLFALKLAPVPPQESAT